ncbi:MAG: bifunctional UDP-N-acetylglucosamine diphosphorylase/glucosamine-1-phosphate N-acetyltransferase GlmU [Pseudomonadota bacterium]
MTKRKTAVVILAAGLGTRMKSARPKALHALAGRPMIQHVLGTLAALRPERSVVVIGPGMEALARAVGPHAVAIQRDRRGTGHAVLAAKKALAGFEGDVLVVFADTPLVRAETLKAMLKALRAAVRPAVVVLGFRAADARAYGRLIVGSDGTLERIVETRDATPTERAVDLCNAGAMAFDGGALFALLGRIRSDNAKKEYYLTDAVAIARALGRTCAVVEAAEAEVMGVNARAELAQAERAVQDALRARAMDGGATLVDPDTVWFSFDTRLGRDVTVGPNVVFGPGVVVGDDVEIRGFCHIEGATIAKGAVVGPFARLRPGARIGRGAHVGNFVEIKNAELGAGAKANHLAYLGDARVGVKANIGAGTITCNYDGFAKHRTEIGAGAFIGSNAALIAPVRIGAGAIVGAGSAIARDVAPDSLALTRSEQREFKGWATRQRAIKGKKKKKKGR